MTVMCIMHNYCRPAGRVTQYIPWWRLGVVYCRARSIYSILLLSCTRHNPITREPAAGWVSSSTNSSGRVQRWAARAEAARSQLSGQASCSPRPCQVCWLLVASNDSSQHSFNSHSLTRFTAISIPHRMALHKLNSTPKHSRFKV